VAKKKVLTNVTPEQHATYPTVYRNLMAVGLLGAVYRQREAANSACCAVEATLADPTEFRTAWAIAQGMGGDAAYAVETLGQRIAANPDDDASKVILGVSLMLAGDPDWRFNIDNVLATSTDQLAREAARNVLEHLQRFIPKTTN
jgi:hypothetical protein